jgi:hypothetical protein
VDWRLGCWLGVMMMKDKKEFFSMVVVLTLAFLMGVLLASGF